MRAGRGQLEGPAAAEWARSRARAARDHHPDRGGDVEGYLEALSHVDAAYGVGPLGTDRVVVHRDRSVAASLARAPARVRRMARSVTGRLPARWRPGRTYIDL